MKNTVTANKGTQTKAFGSAERVNHNSDEYYKRKMMSDIDIKDPGNELFDWNKSNDIDKILCQDSRDLKNIPNNSVALVVTSPPYCVGKGYDQDLSFDEYRKLLKDVFEQCWNVLEPFGRIAVNVANIGRKPWISLTSLVVNVLTEIGFVGRGEIIWDKTQLQNSGTAWGSWKSASDPVLRDRHEYILLFSKGMGKRLRKGTSTITRDEFLAFTQSMWQIRPESAKRIGHPAPYPVELVERLIKLYTYEGDVVLDPFAGACTTAVAAKKLNRHYICIDNVKEYCELGENRINNA